MHCVIFFRFLQKKAIIAPKYEDVKNRYLSISGDAIFIFFVRVKIKSAAF